MQYKITRINRYTTNSSNQPLKTKDGRPYSRLILEIDDPKYIGKAISGFGNIKNAEWQVGDIVNLEIVQNGNYLNFKLPTELEALKEELMNLYFNLEKRIVALEMSMEVSPPKNKQENNLPDEEKIEENLDKIPF